MSCKKQNIYLLHHMQGVLTMHWITAEDVRTYCTLINYNVPELTITVSSCSGANNRNQK